MKKLFLISCLMMGTKAFSQNANCNYVKTKIDDLKGITTVSAETVEDNGLYMMVRKTTKDNITVNSLYIVDKRPIESYSEKGIYLKLSDSTILKDENVKISCEYMPGGSYTDGYYLFIGSLNLDQSSINRLKKNKIVRFAMGFSQSKFKFIESIRLNDFFNCIYKEI